MTTMVELRLATSKQGGSERFACNLEFWNLMIELGSTFGWKPLGATYVATPIKLARQPEARKRDYEPGPWRDAKTVEAQDASRWANALSGAKASRHLRNLTKDHLSARAQPNGDVDICNPKFDAEFADAMDEFIHYLHKGAFSFAAGSSGDIAPMSARK